MVKPDITPSCLSLLPPGCRGPGPQYMFDVAAIPRPPVSHQLPKLFLFRLCHQLQYFPPPIKSWINLRSRGRQVVTTTCSGEGGVSQPTNPPVWRWVKTLHSFSDKLLTLKFRWETLLSVASLPPVPPVSPPPPLPPLQPGLPGRHRGGGRRFLPWRLRSDHQRGGRTWGWSCLVLAGASILQPL